MAKSLLGLGVLFSTAVALSVVACGSSDSSPPPANTAGPGGGTAAGKGGSAGGAGKATGAGSTAAGNNAGGASAGASSGGNTAAGTNAGGTSAGTSSGGTSAGGGTTGGAGGSADVACTNDTDCPGTECGSQVCSWATANHHCVDAGTVADASSGTDGWCTVPTDCKCAAEGATCDATAPHCSFTKGEPLGGGAGGTSAGGSDAGGSGGADAGGTSAGGADAGGSGGTAAGGADAGGAGGAAASMVGDDCEVDIDCVDAGGNVCGGLVCSWATFPHKCALASSGDPGWCDAATDCKCSGATCSATNGCSQTQPGD